MQTWQIIVQKNCFFKFLILNWDFVPAFLLCPIHGPWAWYCVSFFHCFIIVSSRTQELSSNDDKNRGCSLSFGSHSIVQWTVSVSSVYADVNRYSSSLHVNLVAWTLPAILLFPNVTNWKYNYCEMCLNTFGNSLIKKLQQKCITLQTSQR